MSSSLPEQIIDRIKNRDPSAINALPENEISEDSTIDLDNIDFSQLSDEEAYPLGTNLYHFLSTVVITISFWLGMLILGDWLSVAQLSSGTFPVSILDPVGVYIRYSIGLAIGVGIASSYWYIHRAPHEVKPHLDVGFVGNFIMVSMMFLIVAAVSFIIASLLMIPIMLLLRIVFVGTLSEHLVDRTTEGTLVRLSQYILPLVIVLIADMGNSHAEDYHSLRGKMNYSLKVLEIEISSLEQDIPEDYQFDINLQKYESSQFETEQDELAALERDFNVIEQYSTHLETWKKIESLSEDGASRTAAYTVGQVTNPAQCYKNRTVREATELFVDALELCREYDLSDDVYEISDEFLTEVGELKDKDSTSSSDIDQLRSLINREREKLERQKKEYREFLSNAQAYLDEARSHFESSDIAAAKDSLSEFDESVKDVPQASEGAVADLKEEATELRERIAAERIEEKLSNARLARKQSNDALDNEEYNNAIERVKEGLEACRKAEQIQEKEETSEAYAIESIREDLKTHHNEAETIAEQLQNGRKHREAAREALKLQSHEKAENELALLQEVLDELSDYHNSEIDELRTASVEIKEEIEAANKKIDVDEVLNSISSNVTEAENLIEEASFAHAQEQLESAEQTLQETLSQIGSDQSESQSEIETKRNQIESAISLVEEARTQRQSAQRASQAQSYDAAESEISKLQTTIKKIADHDELSVSHDELQQSVTPLKKKIEIDRAENRLNELLGSITSSISRVEDFMNESAYDRAIRRLESVLESVDEASKLNDQYSLGKGKTISQKRDQVETLFSKSEQEPKIKHSEYVSTAEEAISRGIDRREADDPAGAVEAFAEAKDNYSEALKLAQTCDLPELWETEERHSMVVRYLETAREGLDERRQSTQEELEQTLENAESTVRRAEQHADVEDHRSVQESLGDAINHLDEATQLLNVEGVTEKLESRYENLVDRADALNDSLPDEEESGKYRNQELVESLQLLATKIGESPRPEFVNKYGEYPADAYLDAFGSWPEALAAANLDAIDESARDRRTYSRVDVLDEVVKVAKLLGHLPTRTEMNHHGEISATTVENRFQDWDTALEIGDVAQKIDSEDDGELETTERSGVTKEPTETNVEKEISNEHESGEINETGTTSNYVVIGDITENRRLRDPIAVKVCEISSSTGDRKQAKLLVKDIEGIQCWLNVWKKHDINVTWKENNWYILTEARGKEWRNKQGEHKRQLSSTKDLSVSHTGTSPPVRGGEDVLSNESQSATSSSDEITQEDTEDTILDEVMGEFEETGK